MMNQDNEFIILSARISSPPVFTLNLTTQFYSLSKPRVQIKSTGTILIYSPDKNNVW